MNNENFLGAKLKVKRAKTHIQELNKHIEDYLKSQPIKVVVEKDPNSPNYNWTLRVKHDVPLCFAAIIGDIIHNLRASLDLLATELVAKSDGNPKHVYFPFANDENSLDEMINKRHIDRAGDKAIALIKSLKPYKGGNDLLRALHDLDIIDKHRSLIPVAHYAGIKYFQIVNASGPILTIKDMHCGPIRDGMILMRMPPANNVKVGQSFEPVIKLTLDKEVIGNDDELIQLLNSIVTMIEEIISMFEEHLEAQSGEQSS